MSQMFILGHDGPCATVTLNRPERHNAIPPAEVPALQALILEAAARPGARVLILTGAGEKTFCAGADLDGVGEHDWTDNPFERLCDAIEDLPLPTICALNGGVYGGGVDLALACDFRVGADGMRMFAPPAKLGIQYHPSGLRRAATRIGLGPAKRLFLAAETMDADELHRIGFLDYRVAPGQVIARARALAEQLAGLAPLSVAGMKQTLNEIARGRLDEAGARERMRQSFLTEDFAEARRAAAAKRPPQFKGR